jgi:uncharacterized membrane protein YfcA
MSADIGLFLLAVLVTAVAAGAVGAILGLGGGILLVPILTTFFGVSLKYAMGASIVSVVATSSGAAARYLRSRMSNIRIGLFLVMATATGAIAGAHLAGVVPARGLQAVLGLALAYSAFASFRQIGVEAPPPAPSDRWAVLLGHEGTYEDTRLGGEVFYRARRVGWGFLVMFVAGVLSGLLGIGSGAFKVVALDSLMQVPMKVSTATSNFMIGITAAASAGVYFSRGDVHPLVATPVALGVLIGANAGTRVMARMRSATVRKAFLPVLVYLAVVMLLRGLGISPW